MTYLTVLKLLRFTKDFTRAQVQTLIIFLIEQNINMKLAGQVASILTFKHCKFTEKI